MRVGSERSAVQWRDVGELTGAEQTGNHIAGIGSHGRRLDGEARNGEQQEQQLNLSARHRGDEVEGRRANDWRRTRHTHGESTQ